MSEEQEEQDVEVKEEEFDYKDGVPRYVDDGTIELLLRGEFYVLKEDIPFDEYMGLNMPMPNSGSKEMLGFQIRMIQAHLLEPELTVAEIKKLPSKIVSKLIGLIGEDYIKKGF